MCIFLFMLNSRLFWMAYDFFMTLWTLRIQRIFVSTLFLYISIYIHIYIYIYYFYTFLYIIFILQSIISIYKKCNKLISFLFVLCYIYLMLVSNVIMSSLLFQFFKNIFDTFLLYVGQTKRQLKTRITELQQLPIVIVESFNYNGTYVELLSFFRLE